MEHGKKCKDSVCMLIFICRERQNLTTIASARWAKGADMFAGNVGIVISFLMKAWDRMRFELEI